MDDAHKFDPVVKDLSDLVTEDEIFIASLDPEPAQLMALSELIDTARHWHFAQAF